VATKVDATDLKRALALARARGTATDTGTETVSGNTANVERARARATEAELAKDTAHEATSRLKTAVGSTGQTKTADQALNTTVGTSTDTAVSTSGEIGVDVKEGRDIGRCLAVVLATELLKTAAKSTDTGSGRDRCVE